MLVMTTGYNRVFSESSNTLTSFQTTDSNEYVFVYDISGGAPIKKQVLSVPVTYFGIAWDPTSNGTAAHFYVPTCSADYVFVYSYNTSAKLWLLDTNNTPNLGKPGQTPPSPAAPIWLGHTLGIGLDVVPPVNAVPVNAQVAVYPCAAGIALSNTGQTMVVTNYYNDSISILTGGYGAWSYLGGSATTANIDLRPGKSLVTAASGMPGGEYPFWVQVAGSEPNAVAYVSSIRDREIDVVPLHGSPIGVTTRIAVKGQPNKMIMNKAQTLLYVAEDQSDTIDVIDINPSPTHFETVNTVIETIPVIAPAGLFPSSFYSSNSDAANANPIYAGSNTNSLTLSNDETQLYVTNGNLNNVAVVQLTGANSGDNVVGLIPTGWYPNSVRAIHFFFDRFDSWCLFPSLASAVSTFSVFCRTARPLSTAAPLAMPLRPVSPAPQNGLFPARVGYNLGDRPINVLLELCLFLGFTLFIPPAELLHLARLELHFDDAVS